MDEKTREEKKKNLIEVIWKMWLMGSGWGGLDIKGQKKIEMKKKRNVNDERET